MRAGTVTPEMADRMVALYRDGESISGISRRFGVSRSTVQAWLDKADPGVREDDILAPEGGALITSVSWLRLPPVRLRLQLEAGGR